MFEGWTSRYHSLCEWSSRIDVDVDKDVDVDVGVDVDADVDVDVDVENIKHILLYT